MKEWDDERTGLWTGAGISSGWSGDALGLRTWGVVGTSAPVPKIWCREECPRGSGTSGPSWLTVGGWDPVLRVITCRDSQRGRVSWWEEAKKSVRGMTWNTPHKSSRVLSLGLINSLWVNYLILWCSHPCCPRDHQPQRQWWSKYPSSYGGSLGALDNINLAKWVLATKTLWECFQPYLCFLRQLNITLSLVSEFFLLSHSSETAWSLT